VALVKLEIDPSPLEHMAETFKRAEQEMPAAIVRAVGRTGAMAKTRVVRALTKQTGLKRDTIVRAVKPRPAGMSYALYVRGGNVSLKYFKPREVAKGVSVAPWHPRRLYAGAFINSGQRMRAPSPKLHGQVMMRTGKGRLPLHKVKSGLYIPKEFVTGESERAFFDTVMAVLPQRLQHEIARILSGKASAD
jgi:hypothetical protein